MSAFESGLRAAVHRVLSQGLPPKPIVARHWVDPSALTWLGLFCDQTRFLISWSFGALKEGPADAIHTQGVFTIDDNVFPGVNAANLARDQLALIPPDADGATRAFLTRIVGQLGLADLALDLGPMPMPLATTFRVAMPIRPDALEIPSPTPRLPGHAAERVRAAVSHMGPLGDRITALFASPSDSLLDAVRALR